MKLYAINEARLAIRLDKESAGRVCVECGEVKAGYQPEVFMQEGERWHFICKLCASCKFWRKAFAKPLASAA